MQEGICGRDVEYENGVLIACKSDVKRAREKGDETRFLVAKSPLAAFPSGRARSSMLPLSACPALSAKMVVQW